VLCPTISKRSRTTPRIIAAAGCRLAIYGNLELAGSSELVAVTNGDQFLPTAPVTAATESPDTDLGDLSVSSTISAQEQRQHHQQQPKAAMSYRRRTSACLRSTTTQGSILLQVLVETEVCDDLAGGQCW
jgi:hypothetical protein